MTKDVIRKIRDYHTSALVWSFYSGFNVPSGNLFLADGTALTTVGQLEDNGVLAPLFVEDGTPIPVYTDNWLENTYVSADRMGNDKTIRPGGVEYPGGRPTTLDYVAGMDTVNPPQPEPEPEPEPEPDPEPELEVFDEYDLIEAMGDEAPSIEVARAAIRAATDLIDTYTRGAAYRRIRVPRPGVNAVAHTVAARIAANPGFISRRDQAGNFSRSLGAGFTGFTLTEKTTLNSYRRTAR